MIDDNAGHGTAAGNAGGVTRRTVLRTVAVGGGAVASGGVVGATRRTAQSPMHTLMIAANGPAEYSVTVDGELEPDTEGGAFAADDDDEIRPVEREDVAEIRDEVTGPREESAGGTAYYGDRFRAQIPVALDIRPQGDYDVNVYVNERRVGGAEVTTAEPASGWDGPFSLMVTANGPTTYSCRFHEADPALDTDAGTFSADADDAVTRNSDGTLTAADETGARPEDAGGLHVLGDRYLFSGRVEAFEVNSAPDTDVFVYVDERDTTPARVRTNAF
ncbi:hypothetical protein [Halopelagius fulvigenes]|uniref:Uncharacterized protein n=1 Tax=Halopelagius fulvigenes TaxID=1198324 RepID=A0ABD5TZ22_9EURY